MMDLSRTVLTWGSLSVGGSRTSGDPLFIETLDGWDGWEASASFAARNGAHGSFDSSSLVPGRTVVVAGRATPTADRDATLARLSAALVPQGDGPTSDLTIEHAGQVLTAGARLVRWTPSLDVWGVGGFGWAAQWFCPDPRRLSIPTLTTSPLPERIGGLEWPLFGLQDDAATGFLEWGPRGDTGRRTLTNVGTAPAYPVATVTGPLPAGFTLTDVGTGRAVSWSGSLSDGEVVVVDFSPAERSVLLSGSDRTHLLSRAQWWEVPPGSSVQAAFTAPSGSGTVSWSLSSAWW